MEQEEFEKRLQEGEKDFRTCSFKWVELSGKDLSGCNFERATFEFCKLNRLVLRDISMKGTILNCCRLSQLKVNGGDWSHVQITDARTTEVRKKRWTDFPRPFDFESHIGKCDFRNVNMKGCEIHSYITDSLFQYVDFENGNLCRSHFWQTDIKNAKMQQVNFQEVSFSGTISNSLLRGCDFRASLIQNSFICKCDLLKGRYKNMFMRNVKMEWDAIDRGFIAVKTENITYKGIEYKRETIAEL